MWCSSTKVSEPTPRASITCERTTSHMQGKQSVATTYSVRMDAVVYFVTTVPAMKSLLSVSHHDYLPHEYEPIKIDEDIFFKLNELKVTDGNVDILKFLLLSYEHDVQHLQKFIDMCQADYERKMANKLGLHRYFFDQVVQTKVKGSTQNPLPTTHLIYSKTKFTTNKTFENVFFEQRKHVQARTKFFLENRGWYERKGIPYTLGFMLYGPPGTGKTSTIKAVANGARRHIINIQLSEIKTKQQLQHLFFNDEIYVYNGTNTEKYTIPVSERLYVIEDIDAMGDTVLRRDLMRPEPKKKSEEEEFFGRNKEEEKDKFDLSFLLNLLDGTLEASGRILIITTNYPERIDKALIRPGRVDMIVHFKKCSRVILQEMVSAFYEDPSLVVPNDPSLDDKWTPAEVNQILFRNFETPKQALEELVTTTGANEFDMPTGYVLPGPAAE